MESLGDDGNKYLLIAHNAGYDYRFIYEYLQDDTIISKGNGLMNAKGKYWNNRLRKLIDIEIKDSYKLITMPLSKFGKCFSLQQEKEVMPLPFQCIYCAKPVNQPMHGICEECKPKEEEE